MGTPEEEPLRNSNITEEQVPLQCNPMHVCILGCGQAGRWWTGGGRLGLGGGGTSLVNLSYTPPPEQPGVKLVCSDLH